MVTGCAPREEVANLRERPVDADRLNHLGEFGGHLERFLIYDRPLTTSEAISASRALTQQAPIEPGRT